jgi:RNA polymerase sigma-70 factor, ECF subfamily
MHGPGKQDGDDPDARDGRGFEAGEVVLRAEGTSGVLRTGGEGRVLRHGQDDGELRLSLGTLPGGGETEAAWSEFHVRLRAFVSRRVRDRADAEDIVQKVFMEMHRSLPTLRAADRLGAWLYRTARNAIVDHYRAPARRREVPAGDTRDLEVPRMLPSPDDDGEADTTAIAECLTPMVERLPAPYRRAIQRVELRGVTQRAAAESEGISLSGMKARVQRARRQLKASLLECCAVAVDARGGVVGCNAHRPVDAHCGCPPGGRGR